MNPFLKGLLDALTSIIVALGPDVVQGHLDAWKVARAGADAAAAAKFSGQPE